MPDVNISSLLSVGSQLRIRRFGATASCQQRFVVVRAPLFGTHRRNDPQLRQIRLQAPRHGRVVEAAPHLRHEEAARAGCRQNPQQLAVPIDRHDRIAQQPQQVGREIDDGGLDPVRQLEADDVAVAQADLLQAAGKRLRFTQQRPIADRPACLGERQLYPGTACAR